MFKIRFLCLEIDSASIVAGEMKLLWDNLYFRLADRFLPIWHISCVRNRAMAHKNIQRFKKKTPTIVMHIFSLKRCNYSFWFFCFLRIKIHNLFLAFLHSTRQNNRNDFWSDLRSAFISIWLTAYVILSLVPYQWPNTRFCTWIFHESDESGS